MEVATQMSSAWEAARVCIKNSQKKQKRFHNNKAKDPKIVVGDRVFVFFHPRRKASPASLLRPFKVPT